MVKQIAAPAQELHYLDRIYNYNPQFTSSSYARRWDITEL